MPARAEFSKIASEHGDTRQRERHDMKLHEALQQTIRQFGMNVLQEKRLVYILSDCKAFEDYPAMRQVLDAISADVYGKELCRIGMSGSRDDYELYSQHLKKSLIRDRNFSEEFIDYALDSVSYALGWSSSVREPSDHGFDPAGNGSAAGQAGSGSRGNSPQGSAGGTGSSPHGSSGGNGNSPQGGGQPQRKNSGKKWLFVLLIALALISAAVSRYGFDNLQRLAQAYAGDPEAQYMLGKAYAKGNGFDKDWNEALKWYRKAAENGYVKAQSVLGDAYSEGHIVKNDWSEAVRWYRKAADQGDVQAQSQLGYAYEKGNGVEKNSAESVKWLRKAADQGYAVAEHNLGLAYYHGEALEQDLAEAARWFRKAADHGLAEAQTMLGYLYARGEGVEKNGSITFSV